MHIEHVGVSDKTEPEARSRCKLYVPSPKNKKEDFLKGRRVQELNCTVSRNLFHSFNKRKAARTIDVAIGSRVPTIIRTAAHRTEDRLGEDQASETGAAQALFGLSPSEIYMYL